MGAGQGLGVAAGHPAGRVRRLRLINPRGAFSTIAMPEIIRKMTFSRRALFMPLNLAICAAVVPEGWQAEIVDENVLDDPHVPSASGVDAVGIGAMTTQAQRAYELADAYRALGVPVILGGIHPSAMPQEAGQHATIVCRGDAESTLPAALRDLDAGCAKPLYDWATLPPAPMATPRKDLIKASDYLVFNPIQTTRGCPHDCSFCTTPAVFGRKFRQRPIADIVAEMQQARDEYNSRTFIFADDNITGDQKWALELLEAIRPLKIRWASQCDILIARNEKLLRAMHDSGCTGVILGLESPRAATLRAAGKKHANAATYLESIARIQAAGISVWGSFIFGFDGEDWRECMYAARFAQRARLSMATFSILTPYPGTRIFQQYEREGRLLTRDWSRYNGASVVYQPHGVTAPQLRHAQLAAYNEFYSPRSAFQRLRILPVKKISWLISLSIHRGISYYFSRKGRPLPVFADQAEPDSHARIARCLGEAVVSSR